MAVPGLCLLNFLCVLGQSLIALSFSLREESLSATNSLSLNECFFSLTRAHSRSVMIFFVCFDCLGGLISYTVISDERELDLP